MQAENSSIKNTGISRAKYLRGPGVFRTRCDYLSPDFLLHSFFLPALSGAALEQFLQLQFLLSDFIFGSPLFIYVGWFVVSGQY